MSDKNTNLLRRWFEEVWNQGREEAIDEMAAVDIVSHGLFDAQGQHVSGREMFHVFWRQFRTTFPDARVDVDDALAEGDKVMVRCTVHATHSGEGMGSPTGKPISFTGMVVGRIENGLLKEVWDSWNFLSLYQQIGALPASFAQSKL
jgi:steroid delta-isomerase-like uncharacterized protein